MPKIEIPTAVQEVLDQRQLSFVEGGEIRGARGNVLRVQRHVGEEFLLKFATEDDDRRLPDHLEKRSKMLRREARVLEQLGKSAGGLFVDSGELRGAVWLLLRWVEHINLAESFEAMRVYDEWQTLTLTHAISVLERFHELHQLGWLHGDVQPRNIIVSKDSRQIVLTDYEFAHKIGHRDFRYTGGLVHFNAPEVAECMLKKAVDIDYNLETEIYTLGATLFAAYCKSAPIEYGANSDTRTLAMESKLEKIVAGNRKSFEDVGAPPLERLEELIDWCMKSHPKDRPSSALKAADYLEQAL